MDNRELIVDGFVFPNYTEAQVALKEKNNIDVIKHRINMDDQEAVYQIYTKMIERNMFKTVIGYSFLAELRHCLVTKFEYNEYDLMNVEISVANEPDLITKIDRENEKQKYDDLLAKQKKLTISIIALIIMIIAMFIIAALNPNVGYINTENKVLNKYSAWEEELERREEAVKEKEEALNIDTSEDK